MPFGSATPLFSQINSSPINIVRCFFFPSGWHLCSSPTANITGTYLRTDLSGVLQKTSSLILHYSRRVLTFLTLFYKISKHIFFYVNNKKKKLQRLFRPGNITWNNLLPLLISSLWLARTMSRFGGLNSCRAGPQPLFRDISCFDPCFLVTGEMID